MKDDWDLGEAVIKEAAKANGVAVQFVDVTPRPKVEILSEPCESCSA